MTPDEFLQAVDAVARDHIVLARDLRALGATSADVARQRARGELTRQATGIYLTRGAPSGDLQQAKVARAHAGPDAVITGTLGARLLGLRWIPETGKAHTLVPPERRRATTEAWVLVRRCSWIHTLSTVDVDGVRVAPVPQLVVDATRELRNLRDARGVILGAVADGRCSVEEVRTILGRSAVGGTALARQACRDAERGAVSPPEAEAADLLIGRGVPFYVNCEVYLDGVLLGVADIWLVGQGVGGEVDSRAYHADEDVLDATLLRDKRFSGAGLVLHHITPTRLRDDPEGFVRGLLASADDRSRRGIVEPPGLTLRPRGPLLQ
jgi:hypothetical protein